MGYQFIDKQQDLDLAVSVMGRSQYVSVDTESSSFYTYESELCLIQISASGKNYLIDPLANLTVDGLAEIFANPSIVKVMHTAASDISELRRLRKFKFENLFDIMVGCRMLGFVSCSLVSLVKHYTGRDLEKTEQKSNWKKRPLTASQMEYAHRDTIYLEEIMKAMKVELEWVRSNPKARQAKSKARLARYEEMSSFEYQKRNETQEIFIPPGERLGNEVVEFKGVTKSYGDRLLIDNLSFKVPPGAIVGIIGPNGAGKSTLFRMIQGREQPDAGEIVVGPTVNMSSVDQSREGLANDKTVWEAVSGGQDILTVGKFEMPSRAYIGRFNFKGSDQQKVVGNLSGGERGRLHLATTLVQGGNVLLLDEPSNDLDVETLRALEDALLEFAGCVLVISHDRWFLDRIATHILACEGDSQWFFFAGNYHEYEEDKKKRLGEEGAKPHRIRYRPISR